MKLLGLNTLFLRGIGGQWRGSTSPLALFAGGVIGVWFDPSDRTTLFEDVAGTIPATLPGQPVGLMLDKSKGLVLGPELIANGNFDTATGWTLEVGWSISGGKLVSAGGNNISPALIAANIVAGKTYRITYEITSYVSGQVRAELQGGGSDNGIARVSAGVYSELLVAASNRANFRFLAVGGAGFNGTIDNISVRELPGYHATQPVAASRPTLARHPKGGRRNLLNATDALATQAIDFATPLDGKTGPRTLSFTGTGTVTLSGASTGSLVGTGAGNRVSMAFTPTAGAVTFTVSGSVTLAQVEAGGLTNYQKVTNQYDVTEAGVPDCWGLFFDGVDDFMQTSAIDLTGTDKVGVFAGVRKLSDSAARVVAEISTNATSDSNPGAFYLAAPESSSNRYSSLSKGSAVLLVTQRADTGSIGTAPDTAVITATHDISGDLTRIRRNGVFGSVDGTGDKGTGAFGSYPLYIGRRAGTSLPFSGLLYGLCVAGKLPSAAEITNTETFLNSKMGAY